MLNELLVIVAAGWGVLIVAILLNALAKKLNLLTWYDFITKRAEPSFASLIWLFLLYPFGLGLSAYFAISIIK